MSAMNSERAKELLANERAQVEREIATLVTAGRTNKEIGVQLFLSTRTVERHLSHVFRKLGVSCRAQIGAQLS